MILSQATLLALAAPLLAVPTRTPGLADGPGAPAAEEAPAVLAVYDVGALAQPIDGGGGGIPLGLRALDREDPGAGPETERCFTPDEVMALLESAFGEELDYADRYLAFLDDTHVVVRGPEELQARVRSLLEALDRVGSQRLELVVDVIDLPKGVGGGEPGAGGDGPLGPVYWGAEECERLLATAPAVRRRTYQLSLAAGRTATRTRRWSRARCPAPSACGGPIASRRSSARCARSPSTPSCRTETRSCSGATLRSSTRAAVASS